MEEIKRYSVSKIGTDRAFGCVFTVVFLLVSAYAWYIDWNRGVALFASLSVLCLLSAIFAPNLLSPFNRMWLKFGFFLHFYIVNPIIMTAIFFLLFFPIGLLLKIFKKDPLRRKLQKNATSYWIQRDNGSGSGINKTFRNQF